MQVIMDSSEEPTVDYHYKVVLVGEAAVGKTSLRRKYLGKGFDSSHIMTLGADFSMKDVQVHSGDLLRMQLWDIAGQSLFESIRAQFLNGTAAAILVFDITRRVTFDKLEDWLHELWETNNYSDIPLLIIGNKIDLNEDREVTEEDAKNFVDSLKQNKNYKTSFVEYIETSAKTGENVSSAFESLANGTFDLLAN